MGVNLVQSSTLFAAIFVGLCLDCGRFWISAPIKVDCSLVGTIVFWNLKTILLVFQRLCLRIQKKNLKLLFLFEWYNFERKCTNHFAGNYEPKNKNISFFPFDVFQWFFYIYDQYFFTWRLKLKTSEIKRIYLQSTKIIFIQEFFIFLKFNS